MTVLLFLKIKDSVIELRCSFTTNRNMECTH